MKKQVLILALFCSSLIIPEAAKMPSVADVFGGMTEDEITQQVKMGQQFLEDLEKYGTPEEKAQFEQLLLETLNSMSEDDFSDIQNIAKMVEPHLEIPEATPTTSVTPAAPIEEKAEIVTPKASQDETETFKSLINTITQRIDDISQKLNSSKECAEALNIKWKSKATFNNMKRQIYQLQNNRLAQKLSSKNIAAEDKPLVDILQNFQKDLTDHNNNLVIEDDFGLPSNRATEQKHLSQASNIIDMFDNYIDSLMPKLEKFLVKWDPEALQLAKEAEERTTKAAKSAQDALTRKPSANAAPLNTGYGQQNQAYPNQYPNYGQGEYPGYYPEDFAGSGSQGGSAPAQNAKGQAESGTPKQTAPAQNAKQAIADNNKANASSAYDDIAEALEEHLTSFGPQHEQKFISFMNKDMINLPLTDDYGNPAQQPLTEPESTRWVNSDYAQYQTTMMNNIKNTYSKEFKAAQAILEDANKVVREMDNESLRKTANLPEIGAMTQRYTNYKNTYEQTKEKLQTTYDQNYAMLGDVDAKKAYAAQHINFMNYFKTEVEDKVETVLDELGHLQRKIRRQSNRKQLAEAALPKTQPNILSA